MSYKPKREEYLQEIDEHVSDYVKQARVYAWWHNLLQVLVILLSVCVPFLLHISFISNWVPTILSLVVAAAAGVDKYFQFGEKSRLYRNVSDLLRQEKRQYLYGAGSYSSLTEARKFEMFVEQAETHVTLLIKGRTDFQAPTASKRRRWFR